MIKTLLRVLTGFILACLTAGFVQVLFAMPPGALLSAPASVLTERAGQIGVLALLAATHAAIFSGAFALIAAGVGEWTGTRAVGYYLFAGVVIALLGFSAQFASEAPGAPTVLNNYALKAFLTSGFFAGLAYWLAAGHKAGRRARDDGEATADADTIGVPPPAKTWKNRPRLVIEDAPKPGSKDSRKASLAERLADSEDGDLQIIKAEAKAVAEATRPGDATSVAATVANAAEAAARKAGNLANKASDAVSDAKDKIKDAARAALKPADPEAPKTSVPSTKSSDNEPA